LLVRTGPARGVLVRAHGRGLLGAGGRSEVSAPGVGARSGGDEIGEIDMGWSEKEGRKNQKAKSKKQKAESGKQKRQTGRQTD
jgi:hypothetical protein